MDPTLVAFVAAVAVLSLVPGWITAAILRKSARKDGESGREWLPLWLLPYALTRFRHPNKVAIVWGYLFSNLLFFAALVAFVVLWKSRRP